MFGPSTKVASSSPYVTSGPDQARPALDEREPESPRLPGGRPPICIGPTLLPYLPPASRGRQSTGSPRRELFAGKNLSPARPCPSPAILPDPAAIVPTGLDKIGGAGFGPSITLFDFCSGPRVYPSL